MDLNVFIVKNLDILYNGLIRKGGRVWRGFLTFLKAQKY